MRLGFGRFILHAKKTAFIVEHDFIMATYLADRVIVFEGEPGSVPSLKNGSCASFLCVFLHLCISLFVNFFVFLVQSGVHSPISLLSGSRHEHFSAVAGSYLPSRSDELQTTD